MRLIVDMPIAERSREDDAAVAKSLRIFQALLMTIVLALPSSAGRVLAQDAGSDLLRLETKIPLGAVAGRIDHMAIDLARRRLFVAELGNGSVGVVDLNERKVVQAISGLKQPQGVGYEPLGDMLYVASAGDGSVRMFKAADYEAAGRIDLGDDADNVRIDVASNRVFIGYGSGALAVVDPNSRSKIADIALKAHPESFQLDSGSERAFVNTPDARAIAVVDRASGKQIANWPTGSAGANFPMALDHDAQQVIVVFRNPARLGVFAMRDGAVVTNAQTCGDSDDLFVDAKRHRVYVSCGEGFVDVFDTQGSAYRRIARIPTVAGARTSLFVPELDRLFVAIRVRSGQPSAIWAFRPMP